MKKTTTLLGILGVVGMFYACAVDTVSAPDNEISTNTSSSTATSSAVSSSASQGVKDSVVHQTVIIQSAGSHAVPYPGNETFCWTDKCEKENNTETPKSSSSYVINVTMSSEAQLPPTINGDKMIDNRDNKEYPIATIAGKRWMTKNLNFATKTGYYCQTKSSEDMCSTYGGFYSYGAASRACPEGWRLPTQDEVETLDAAVEHEWWQVGGRFKLSDGEATDYGLDDEQGYIWIQAGEYSSFRIKNYSGDSPHEFQSGSSADRAYNVRCVQD